MPPACRTDRRRGYLIAINSCGRSVELALQTCRAAAFPCENVEGLLREARELMNEAVELGDPTEWTREKDLEALRLMGRASTILSRAVGHVWIGCGAGEAAAVEANDPSVARAAAERALPEIRGDGSLRSIEPAPAPRRSPCGVCGVIVWLTCDGCGRLCCEDCFEEYGDADIYCHICRPVTPPPRPRPPWRGHPR